MWHVAGGRVQSVYARAPVAQLVGVDIAVSTYARESHTQV